MRNDTDALMRWLREHRVAHLCVVSPHLDDAAFSLASLLVLPPLPPRRVLTVFSHGRDDADATYARAMGFASVREEFEARREEDRRAMALLSVPFEHAGALADRFDEAAAQGVADAIVSGSVRDVRATGERALILLPAGAGGQWSAAARLWRRLLRLPLGSGIHAEHEWVRDRLRHRLADVGLLVGYYAELPYLWAQGAAALHDALHELTSQPLEALAIPADASHKLRVARAYASQVVSEFGTRESYQRRSLSGPEWVFLPRRS